MPPPSLARSFFDQIRAAPDSVAFLRGLVSSTPPTYETDWLDFKQQPSSNLKDGKWRELWVEALCGFANNQGGVLIWGIDARKDPVTNTDAACGERPVDNPVGLKSRLTELQRGATDPVLANVEVDAFELPSAPGTGFVVCFVPEGPFKPYRTEDGRRSQYYIRSGDNFTILSRSMLQSLFYPRSKAVFKAMAKLSWDLLDMDKTGGRHVSQMVCNVGLLNDGTATAKTHTLARVSSRLGESAQGVAVSTPWIYSGAFLPVADFRTTVPLHPGIETPLFSVRWQVEAGASTAMGNIVVPLGEAPCFELTVFCENQEPQDLKIEFQKSELRKQAGEAVCKAGPVE
jgi:hypothetical protein